MTRHPPLRRGVKWQPDDGSPRCPVVRFGDTVDRCSSRAEPLHDLHSASGIDADGEVYGCAWITRAALPAPPAPELGGAILALGFAVDETTARYWLAACARRGADQPMLDHLWSTWLELNRPQVIYSDPTPREERP